MRSFLFLLVCCAGLSLLCSSVCLGADEQVFLGSGEVVIGELIRESPTEIEIRRLVLVKRVPVPTSIILQKNQISRRVPVPSPLERYAARVKQAADTLEGQCAMSRWCMENCLMDQALVHARKADGLDDQNPIVAKLFADLGYLKDKGQWVKESDFLSQTGQVDFNGKIMSPAEADQRKALILATSARDQLAQQIKDAEWVIANHGEKITDATKKVASLKEQQGKAKGDQAQAKAKVENLDKRIADQQGKQPTPARQDRIDQDTKDRDEASKALSKATSDLKAADHKLADAQKQLDSLQQALDKAKADLPTLKTKLDQAEAEVVKCKVALGEAPETPPAQGGKPDAAANGTTPPAGDAATKPAAGGDKDKKEDKDKTDPPSPKSRLSR